LKGFDLKVGRISSTRRLTVMRRVLVKGVSFRPDGQSWFWRVGSLISMISGPSRPGEVGDRLKQIGISEDLSLTA
jgi:hypothetical protein